METSPYILALSSHKGGTGRTTAALALAWCWGRAGFDVVLADADSVHAAEMVCLGEGGTCSWLNVHYHSGLPDPETSADLVVVDCPNLSEPVAGEILRIASGVLLSCQADPMSLRTVRSAAEAVHSARQTNPDLELLGIVVGLYDADDPVQPMVLKQLAERHGELLLEPAVPRQPEMGMWAGSAGQEPPSGLALDAFHAIADGLAGWLRTARS